MELGDLLKVYGPLGMGWVGFAYLMKFILDRYNSDIEARLKLAAALDKLTDRVTGGRGVP